MKIIIVVDVQNDFITGPFGSDRAVEIIPNIINRLKEYDSSENIILFTKDTHGEDYLKTQEGKNLPIPHCIRDTPGWSIVKEVASFVDHSNFLTYSTKDVINSRVLKDTFGSMELVRCIGNIITEVEDSCDTIEEIVFMGVCTDICVVSNALMVKAACPEVKITVDASCCAGLSEEKHLAALDVMRSCQVNIIND